MKKKWVIYVVLALLVVIGGLLRLYQVGADSYWIDEAFSVYAAQQVVQTGAPVLESGWRYGYLPHTYALAGLFWLFGSSEAVARLLSVLLGLAMMYVGFLLGKEFGSWKSGLFVAAVLAFSSWEIAWSRQARGYMLLQVVFSLFLLLWLRQMRLPTVRRWYALVIVGVLTMLTHPFGYSIVGIVACLCVYCYFFEKNIRAQMIARFREAFFLERQWTFVLAIVVGVVVALLVALRLLTTSVAAWQYGLWYGDAYWWFLSSFVRVFFYVGLVGMVLLLFEDRKAGLLLLLAFVLPLLFLSTSVLLFHYRYVFFLFPVLVVGCSVVVEKMLSLRARPQWLVTGALLVVIAFAFFSSGMSFSLQKSYDLEWQTPQPDFKAAYQFLESVASPHATIVVGNTVPAYLYYGQVDYWLPFSLSHRSFVNETDAYLGMQGINASGLAALEGEVFVVVDELAWRRIDDKTRAYISENMTSLFFRERDEYSKIWVYKR